MSATPKTDQADVWVVSGTEGPFSSLLRCSRQLELTLSEIAEIAHEGGRLNLSESDALNKVRKLTIPYWKNAAPDKEVK